MIFLIMDMKKQEINSQITSINTIFIEGGEAKQIVNTQEIEKEITNTVKETDPAKIQAKLNNYNIGQLKSKNSNLQFDNNTISNWIKCGYADYNSSVTNKLLNSYSNLSGAIKDIINKYGTINYTIYNAHGLSSSITIQKLADRYNGITINIQYFIDKYNGNLTADTILDEADLSYIWETNKDDDDHNYKNFATKEDWYNDLLNLNNVSFTENDLRTIYNSNPSYGFSTNTSWYKDFYSYKHAGEAYITLTGLDMLDKNVIKNVDLYQVYDLYNTETTTETEIVQETKTLETLGIVADVANGGKVTIKESEINVTNVSAVAIYGADIIDSYIGITNDLSKNPNSVGVSGIRKYGLYWLEIEGSDIGIKGTASTSTVVNGGVVELKGNNTGINGESGDVLVEELTLKIEGKTRTSSRGIKGARAEIKNCPIVEITNTEIGVENAKLTTVGATRMIVKENGTGLKGATVTDSYLTIEDNTTGINGGQLNYTSMLIKGNTNGVTGNATFSGSAADIRGNQVGVLLNNNILSLKGATIARGTTTVEMVGLISLIANGTGENKVAIKANNNSNINISSITVIVEDNDMAVLEGGSNITVEASTITLDATGITVKNNTSNITVKQNSIVTYGNEKVGTVIKVESGATGTIKVMDNSRLEGAIIGSGTKNVTLTNRGALAQAKGSNISKLTTDGTGIIILNIDKTNKVDKISIGKSGGDIQIGSLSNKILIDIEGEGHLAEKEKQEIVTANTSVTVAAAREKLEWNGYWYKIIGGGSSWSLECQGVTANNSALNNVPGLTNAVVTAGLNSLTRRLGDIRRTPQDKINGVWTRVYGRNDKFTKEIETKMEMTGAEGGYDRQVLKDKKDRYYVGLMAGYQNISKIEHKIEGGAKQTGEGTTPSIGAYATWIAENGMFADITVRNFWISLEMNLDDTKYKPYRNQIAISGEIGKEFVLATGKQTTVVIEPKTEWVYSYAGESGNSELEYGQTNSIKGKVGFMLGLNAQGKGEVKWQPYMEAGYSYEFDNKTQVKYLGYARENDLSGGYGDIGIGLNGYFGKGFSGYSLISYEKGPDQENVVYNIGIRYGF